MIYQSFNFLREIEGAFNRQQVGEDKLPIKFRAVVRGATVTQTDKKIPVIIAMAHDSEGRIARLYVEPAQGSKIEEYDSFLKTSSEGNLPVAIQGKYFRHRVEGSGFFGVIKADTVQMGDQRLPCGNELGDFCR